jgi:hypothetical protein
LQDIATALRYDIDFSADAVSLFRENTSVFDLQVDSSPRPPAQMTVGCGTETFEVGGGIGAVEDRSRSSLTSDRTCAIG